MSLLYMGPKAQLFPEGEGSRLLSRSSSLEIWYLGGTVTVFTACVLGAIVLIVADTVVM